MAAQTFSGYNVPQAWGKKTNYQGGQGGQLVTYAGVTWRAIKPYNGRPPNTISGEWEQVPATITSPNVQAIATAAANQAVANIPVPPPPPPSVPLSASPPLYVGGNVISISTFVPSGLGAFPGAVPAPSTTAGTTNFLCEDGTWKVPAGGGGGVSSVGLATPAEFTVSGSPVTGSGTLTFAWASEAQNLVLASPSGSSGTPSFRAITPADLAGTPGAGKYWDGSGTWTTLPAPGTGTVTSVAMTVPTELSVGGSPITASGTLTLSWNSAAQHAVFAGPSGSAGTPAFRALIATDLPATAVTPATYTYATITVDQQGRITSAASGSAPTGTVTSVALTVPSIFSIGGSPVTTSGTLAIGLQTQAINLVWAGPASGSATTPTFRAIVPADLAGTPGAGKYWDGAGSGAWTTLPAPGTGTVTSVAMTVPADMIIGGSPITASGTLALSWGNESANVVHAGPTSGGAATPTWRALVAADMPSGVFPARGTHTVATSSLAPNGIDSSQNLSIGGKSAMLLKCTTDIAAWVVLYADAAARTADSTRLQTQDPTPGSGVLAEFITTASVLTINTSPPPMISSEESSPNTFLPIRVTNLSAGTTVINVTILSTPIEQ